LMRIRRRHPLSSKDLDRIQKDLSSVLPPEKTNRILVEPLEEAAGDEYDLILSEQEPVAFTVGGVFFPTLKGFLRIEIEERHLTVDSGAVPYLVNGADIMAPGVVAWDPELEKGDLCVVTEERHNKPLSVAGMLVEAAEIDPDSKGKVAKNIHHVGDPLWNAEVD